MRRNIALFIANYDDEISTYNENELNKYLELTSLEEYLKCQIAMLDIGANVYLIDNYLNEGKFRLLIDLLNDERDEEMEKYFYDDRIIKTYKNREVFAVNTKKMIDALKSFIGVMTFGKYKGERIEDVIRKNPSYFDWMKVKGMTDYPEYKRYLIMKNAEL
ncbi:exodeoxyribonuclease X C-terminal domain-containing protein [Paenibacillus sp. CAU 1782]